MMRFIAPSKPSNTSGIAASPAHSAAPHTGGAPGEFVVFSARERNHVEGHLSFDELVQHHTRAQYEILKAILRPSWVGRRSAEQTAEDAALWNATICAKFSPLTALDRKRLLKGTWEIPESPDEPLWQAAPGAASEEETLP